MTNTGHIRMAGVQLSSRSLAVIYEWRTRQGETHFVAGVEPGIIGLIVSIPVSELVEICPVIPAAVSTME